MGVLIGTSSWPDGIDGLATLLFLFVAIGVPVLGYVFIVLDVRAYLRSLRRGLVRLFDWQAGTPAWAHTHTPRCLEVFELKLPCDESQLLAAYRQRVKNLHPDHGGDKRRFLALQAHFEEAMRLVRESQMSST